MIKTHLSLVLVDGFFAIHLSKIIIIMKKSHNPYFNRWFSAIVKNMIYHIQNSSHNPYFNRWFSAIDNTKKDGKKAKEGHNPYFNRWFSAIRCVRICKSR